jgi:hypothetical protein
MFTPCHRMCMLVAAIASLILVARGMQFTPPDSFHRLATIGPQEGLSEHLRRALEPGQDFSQFRRQDRPIGYRITWRLARRSNDLCSRVRIGPILAGVSSISSPSGASHNLARRGWMNSSALPGHSSPSRLRCFHKST